MTRARELVVETPGVLASVQDCGRLGVAHLGVSPSGVADWYSARAANLLVGNDACAALIETSNTASSFEMRASGRVAVAGASGFLHIDGRHAAAWRSHDVPAGSRIELDASERGARSYLAIDGGLHVPLVLGSAATDLGAGFGGFEGRALKAGDVVRIGDPGVAGDVFQPRPALAYAPESIPHWSHSTALRVVAGPYRRSLPDRAWDELFARTYVVTSRSTRQGLQLEGVALRVEGPTDIVSAGACAGCVQITSAGLPVILLAEHQTTGGYATVACVSTADLPRAGQLGAGDRVRFELVTQADAAHALSGMKRLLYSLGTDMVERLGAGFHEGI